MKTRILLSLLFVMTTLAALGAEHGVIEHTPPGTSPGERQSGAGFQAADMSTGCLVPNEMTILTVETGDEGILRAYFLPEGAQDWCFVDGVNTYREGTHAGRNSQVTLPMFEGKEGASVKYYFVVLDSKDSRRVLAKSSPTVAPYLAKIDRRCTAMFARHAIIRTMECNRGIAASTNAGYAAKTILNEPPQSPEKPEQAARNTSAHN
jgi:hypothetical protein